MPSWEDIINQVVIPGDPKRVREAAATWSVVFAGIASTRDTLEAGLRGLESWEGETADAYRTHITQLCDQLDQLHQQYSSVQHLLESAAGSLQTAIDHIEIPAEMAHFIDQAKQGFVTHHGLSGLGPDALYNMAEPIYNNRMASVMSTLTPDAVQNGISKLRDAFSDDADKAKAVYRKLNNEYGNVHASLPQPIDEPPRRLVDVDKTVGATDFGTQSSPSGPSLPSSDSQLPVLSTMAPNSTTGLDPLGSNHPSSWDGGAGDWDPTVTGLAGAGDGGLGGLGGSGSGLGSLGAGSGLGALGSGSGSGSGIAPGNPGSRPGGLTTGAGAGRQGTVGTGRGGMGAPGTGGSGTGGNRAERRTWLTEADDIWGDDSEQLSPGVLGRIDQPAPEAEQQPEAEHASEKTTE